MAIAPNLRREIIEFLMVLLLQSENGRRATLLSAGLDDIRKTVNLQDEACWAEQHQWLTETLDALHNVLSRRIKKLQI